MENDFSKLELHILEKAKVRKITASRNIARLEKQCNGKNLNEARTAYFNSLLPVNSEISNSWRPSDRVYQNLHRSGYFPLTIKNALSEYTEKLKEVDCLPVDLDVGAMEYCIEHCYKRSSPQTLDIWMMTTPKAAIGELNIIAIGKCLNYQPIISLYTQDIISLGLNNRAIDHDSRFFEFARSAIAVTIPDHSGVIVDIFDDSMESNTINSEDSYIDTKAFDRFIKYIEIRNDAPVTEIFIQETKEYFKNIPFEEQSLSVEYCIINGLSKPILSVDVINDGIPNISKSKKYESNKA